MPSERAMPSFLDIALKVARALQHVAQDALGRELVVVGPRYFLAVLVEGGIEQILERLFVGDILDALQAFLIFDVRRLSSRP